MRETYIKLTQPEYAWVEKFRQAIRVKHFTYATEKCYCGALKRYLRFLREFPQRELTSEKKVEAYLTARVKRDRIGAKTQDQEFHALRAFYSLVREQPLGEIDALRPNRPTHIRTAQPFEVVEAFLASVPDEAGYPTKLVAHMLYGPGARLSEPLNLRVKDIDLRESQMVFRGAKGQQDRVRPIPCNLIEPIREQLRRSRFAYEEAMRTDIPIQLPNGLARKYPAAQRSWAWWWLFPAKRPLRDPRSQELVWWHFLDKYVQAAFREAAREHKLEGVMTPHVLRHSWATHEYKRTRDLVAIQKALGHKSLETTAIYVHADMEAGCPIERMQISLAPTKPTPRRRYSLHA